MFPEKQSVENIFILFSFRIHSSKTVIIIIIILFCFEVMFFFFKTLEAGISVTSFFPYAYDDNFPFARSIFASSSYVYVTKSNSRGIFYLTLPESD